MKIINKKMAAAASALLLTGLLLADSKYNLKITEQSLYFDKLPATFDGMNIVHLSDLHGASFGKDNAHLAKAVKELAPDIIVMTGDMADNIGNIDVFEALLQRISSIAPCYYVSGNHEWGGLCMPEIIQLLDKYGVRYLSNEYEPVYRNGEKIIVAGVDDPMGRANMIKPDELAESIRKDHPDDFVMLLGHRNYWVEEYFSLPVDLIFCGHAHGGLVRLPVIGGVINVKHSLFAEHEKGIYHGENFVMNVSCGLGNSVYIPRFLNRPEIVSIKLYKS